MNDDLATRKKALEDKSVGGTITEAEKEELENLDKLENGDDK